ncbi:MAG: hypothetical protein QY308_04870 [Ignavibacteriaceae bacterium]|nr:MAG: hypothetical protein QY308_04870 [Ignavibacteriaceae bacterium]
MLKEVPPALGRCSGFVPGSGTKVGITAYSFTDRNLAAGNYTYRLKQTDLTAPLNIRARFWVEVGAVPTEYSLSQTTRILLTQARL